MVPRRIFTSITKKMVDLDTSHKCVGWNGQNSWWCLLHQHIKKIQTIATMRIWNVRKYHGFLECAKTLSFYIFHILGLCLKTHALFVHINLYYMVQTNEP
jgi:hypothetical protein